MTGFFNFSTGILAQINAVVRDCPVQCMRLSSIPRLQTLLPPGGQPVIYNDSSNKEILHYEAQQQAQLSTLKLSKLIF